MNEDGNLSWSMPAYEEKYRSPDWFWALGVIAITIAITSIIYSNYFFAILILISSGLLYFFATETPEIIDYTINDKGLKIKDHIFLFENIKSFYVQKDHKPTLFIKTERFFMPTVSIPIEYDMADSIKNIFDLKKIKEEEMREHPSEKIMDTLGF
jgi:hypothetical protein